MHDLVYCPNVDLTIYINETEAAGAPEYATQTNSETSVDPISQSTTSNPSPLAKPENLLRNQKMSEGSKRIPTLFFMSVYVQCE